VHLEVRTREPSANGSSATSIKQIVQTMEPPHPIIDDQRSSEVVNNPMTDMHRNSPGSSGLHPVSIPISRFSALAGALDDRLILQLEGENMIRSHCSVHMPQSVLQITYVVPLRYTLLPTYSDRTGTGISTRTQRLTSYTVPYTLLPT